MQPPPIVRLSRPPGSALPEADRRVEEARAADAAGRHDEAAALLRQAAELGHPVALALLGARLMVGRPAPPVAAEAVWMLRRAADLDQADAHLILATLAAASAGTPEQWGPALDHLQRAAELGSGRAQGQLGLLSGHVGALSADPGVWAALRRAIDVEAWMQPPPRRVLSEAPRIRAVEGFLPPTACDWLIERARPLLQPATVYDLSDGAFRQEPARTNSAVRFDALDSDLVMMLVRARIGRAVSLPPMAMEFSQVLHYEVGQRFTPHVDYFDPAAEAYAGELATGGQRIATFLLYLNDDYEGGETAFPRLGLRHRGRKGDALFFANVDHANRPDPRTLHAGEAPSSGVKWLFSQWIRDRAGPPLAAAAPS